MKRIFTFLGVLAISLGLNAQTYLQEDFSTFTNPSLPPLASGWKNIDSTATQNGQTWRFDNPGAVPLSAPISSPAAILDSDDYGPNNNQDAYLESPSFDASLATVVNLEFDHYFNPLTGSYGLVQVYDGSKWVTVDSITTSPDPEHKVIDISAQAAGNANAQIRFNYNNGGQWAWYWIVDNIDVYQPAPDDIKLISVDDLQASCGLSSNEPIIATFTNVGTTTIPSVPLNYIINGGTPVNDVYATNPVLPGDTIQFTFSQGANFSTIGTYNVVVYSSLRGDANAVNDTATGVAQQKNSITTFPYFQDFESGPGNWTTGGTNSSWAHGAPAGTAISSAYSGNNAWVTNLTGDYNNDEESFIIGPCFDFTNVALPQFKARIWIESENSWDGTVLQSSIDGGLSWQKVGNFLDPNNWYNDNSIAGLQNIEPSQEGWTGTGGSWVLAEHDLTGLAGQPSVELRIAQGTDFTVTEEGFAIDDILVQDAPSNDLGVVALANPNDGCGLSSADTVCLSVVNFGSTAATSFSISYSFNGGAAVTETITANLNPGDTTDFCFSTASVNLSAPGSYFFDIWTTLAGDANTTNDSLFNIEVKNTLKTFPYSTNFDVNVSGSTGFTFNNDWVGSTTGSGNFLWTANSGTTTSTNTGPTSDHTTGSTIYMYTEASSPAVAGDEASLTSPCIDLTTQNPTAMTLEYWYHMYGVDIQTLFVEMDSLGTWVVVDTIVGQQQTANADPYLQKSIAVNQLAGLNETRIRFRTIRGSSFDGDVAIDDIRLYQPSNDDVGVVSISSPTSGCGLTTDSVRVCIVNFGLAASSNIPLAYTLNGGTPVTDVFTGSIQPGDTACFTFATNVNVSAVGTYNLTAYTNLANDGDVTNDSTSTTFDNIPVISALPYTEGFETNNGGWSTYGANSSWAHGSPAGTYITAAANGSNAWVTNLLGDYNNNELAYLESPCMDFSSLTVDPTMSFSHIFNTESCCDEGWVEVSTNAGQTWTKLLASPNAINWYNDLGNQWWDGDHLAGTGSWHLASNELTGVAGSASVKIRFVFSSDGSVTNDGFGVDDINIAPPAADDASLVSITKPNSGCALGSADSVAVLLANVGTASMSNVSITYVLNGGTPVTETIAGPINSGDTIPFTFTNTVNLSTFGTYNLTVYISLANDPNQLNDTLNISFDNVPVISGLPYTEDFESGNGGWTASGTNSSWAHGTPAGTYITGAANGSNAWVTNLTGDYNNSELSYLESPCMDFSSISIDPTLNFSHIHNTESCCDEGWIEVSTNAGSTWTKLIAGPNAINWYNDLGNQWWDGDHAAGTGVWHAASTVLSGVAGNSNVKIRFVFSSDGSVTNDGFGVDDINIAPPAADDAAIVDLSAPGSSCGFGTSDSVKVLFTNNGTNAITSLDLSYSMNGSAYVTETFTGNLLSGDTAEYTFNATVNLSIPGTYTFDIAVDLFGDPNSLNDSIGGINVLNSLQTIPYVEDFDALAGGQTGQLSNGWNVSPSANGNFEWITNIGGTISGATGPTGDNTTGSTTYIYTEASSPAAAGDMTILTSPCVDISSNTGDLTLIYHYHMFGADIQTLYVDLDTNGTWTNIDSIVGQVQTANADPYNFQVLPLNQFANANEVRVRFWTVRGASFDGDIAIDDVSITGQPVGLEDVEKTAAKLSFYPNPSNGEVKLLKNSDIQIDRLEVYNLKGQLVMNLTEGLNQNFLQLDLSHLPKGVYTIKSVGDQFTQSDKLIIQ
ncbi:MAG: T9SS type A sorting domain-containing protein [Vicingaceae bacterium]